MWGIKAKTYTATVYVSLFGRRETKLENGCLTPKTILNRQHKLSNLCAQNTKYEIQSTNYYSRAIFFPSMTRPGLPTKQCFFSQVSIVYWWLSITSSVIRLWFLQCYRLTLIDWWKRLFHHTYHSLLVGDNNFSCATCSVITCLCV